MSTALDYILVGALAASGLVAAALLAWAFAYQGRTRYSAHRRGQSDGQ